MSDLGARFDALHASGRLAGLHGVVVLHHGEPILERYLQGEDWVWGRSLGHVVFTPETLHDLRSITKSVVSLLYGIALQRGLVPPPTAPLLAQFPGCADLAPTCAHLTVAHALSMTMGTDWNERLPYTDPNNSEIAMEMAPDRWRYILSRDVLGPAGEGWIYGGGAVALIGHLIERGTGQDLSAFAASPVLPARDRRARMVARPRWHRLRRVRPAPHPTRAGPHRAGGRTARPVAGRPGHPR